MRDVVAHYNFERMRSSLSARVVANDAKNIVLKSTDRHILHYAQCNPVH